MTDVLDRPRTPAEYRTLAMLADISDLRVDARKRLMSLIYEHRERERQLLEEVEELRRRLDRSDGRSRSWTRALRHPFHRRSDRPEVDLSEAGAPSPA
jgi:hypothetical protein